MAHKKIVTIKKCTARNELVEPIYVWTLYSYRDNLKGVLLKRLFILYTSPSTHLCDHRQCPSYNGGVLILLMFSVYVCYVR